MSLAIFGEGINNSCGQGIDIGGRRITSNRLDLLKFTDISLHLVEIDLNFYCFDTISLEIVSLSREFETNSLYFNEIASKLMHFFSKSKISLQN